MAKIAVYLSDFQFLTRQGMISLIKNHNEFELSGAEENFYNVLKDIKKKRPDVLVIDYRKDDGDFKEKVENVKALGLYKILVMSADAHKERLKKVLKTGVKGMITKTCSEQEITNSIFAIYEGNRFYCNRILDIVMDEKGDEEEEVWTPTNLSPREFEVLKLITKGLSTVKIADNLCLSVHTINSHRKNILKKLNLKSPTELIVYAMESGISR